MLSKVLEIRDFSIVVLVDNHTPSILNPDFLKYNHIVPMDWELGRPPICSPAGAQVIFNNGINILAQPDKITFWEYLQADNFSPQIAEVSAKYIDKVRYVNYRAVGLNFNAHIVADQDDGGTQDFIVENLIANGPWKNFKGFSPDVGVNFTYTMDNQTVTITLNYGFLEEDQSPDKQPVPILNFSANFHRNISENSPAKNLSKIQEIIRSWETDLNTFKSLVTETFLSVDSGK
ncbi:MAG TPA: hypothetical protein V6D13_10135 [Halomicronema sp.]